VLAFLLAAAPASASVTVGQLDPGGSPATCGNSFDFLQPTVTSGNSYVVPYAGTITSWTTKANGTGGLSMGLKIFRKVSDPMTYRSISSDGPRLLTPGGTAGNTFPAAIQVQKGDVLGVNVSPTPGVACLFPVPGDHYLYRYAFPLTTLPDGQEASFGTAVQEDRLNVSAVLEPSNAFSLGTVTRNRKKGTASLAITTPNPGTLAVGGKGATAKVAAADATVPAGPVRVKVRAKGKRAATLNQTGKVKLNLSITFTPTSGAPGTQQLKVKLRKG
jgi:hypothetical protein